MAAVHEWLADVLERQQYVIILCGAHGHDSDGFDEAHVMARMSSLAPLHGHEISDAVGYHEFGMLDETASRGDILPVLRRMAWDMWSRGRGDAVQRTRMLGGSIVLSLPDEGGYSPEAVIDIPRARWDLSPHGGTMFVPEAELVPDAREYLRNFSGVDLVVDDAGRALYSSDVELSALVHGAVRVFAEEPSLL